MAMKAGELFKKEIIRWLDEDGRRVSPNTPGAKRVVKKSRKWYGYVKDPKTGKWQQTPLSTDKQAARKKLSDLETKLARGEAGLLDPYADTKRSPVGGLVDEYLTDLAEQGRTEEYRRATRRLLDTVIEACQLETLADLTVEALDGYLTGLTCSARTKNTYRGACYGLMNYLVGKDRLADNPLRKVTRRKGEVKRRRRAETPTTLQRLLTAARERPLVRATDRPRRGPNKGQLCAERQARREGPALRGSAGGRGVAVPDRHPHRPPLRQPPQAEGGLPGPGRPGAGVVPAA